MKNVIKYAAVGAVLFVAYKVVSQKKSTVSVKPVTQYPAAWADYWATQNESLTDQQKTLIQNQILKGNIKYT